MPYRGVPVSLGSHDARTVSAGTFVITEAKFGGHTRLSPHHHDRAIIAVTLSGSWQSLVGSRGFELNRSQLLVEPAGDTHSNRFGESGAHVLAIQPDARDERLRACAPLLQTPRQLRSASAIFAARRIAAELTLYDNLSSLAIESVVLDMISTAGRALDERSAAHDWFRHVVDYMHASFLETPSLDTLAHMASVHPAHFARQFRRTYGVAPVSYLRRLRVEWAAEQLRKTARSLADIASAGGFSDQSHFTRTFQRFTGVTPSTYRRRSLSRRRERH